MDFSFEEIIASKPSGKKSFRLDGRGDLFIFFQRQRVFPTDNNMNPSHMYSHPHGNVLYRKLRQQFPCMVRGEGIFLLDENGKRYIDASGGAIVANLGHGNKIVAEAMARQAAESVGYVSGMQFTHRAVEDLAAALCAVAPAGMNKAFFLSGGSEATEAAMKLARQYWVAKGMATN